MMTRYSIRQSALVGAALSFSALGCNDSKTVGTIENTGGTSAVTINNTGGALASGGASNGTAGSGGSAPSSGGAATDAGTVQFTTNDAGQPIMPLPVLDPAGTYGGKTYAEWDAAWYKWFLGLPGPVGAFTDTTGAYCAVGQSAALDGGGTQPDVFFLGNAAGGLMRINCTIPSGEMVYLPLETFFRDNALGSQGGDAGSLTDDQLEANLKWAVESVTEIMLQIDGISYGSKLSDFAAYLSGPTQFSYTVPDTPTNIAAALPDWYGTSTFSGTVPNSFCAGYGILLAPLPAGSHTIHAFAVVGNYTDNITYNLTVE